MTTKTCTNCKTEKPITEFRFRKSQNNYYAICKQCQNEYNKKYHETHKEEQKQRCKAYYEQNKEQQKQYKKEYYQLNKEYFSDLRKQDYILKKDYYIAKAKTYYNCNKDICKKRRRKYHLLNKEYMNELSKKTYYSNKGYYQKLAKKYRETHKDEIKIKKKEYLQTPTGKLNHLISCQKRRILKKNIQYDPNTNKYLEYLINKPTKICFICGKKIKKNEQYTIEHIIPISREGRHIIENVGLAHKACNSSKCNRLPNEYVDYKLTVDGFAQTKIL
jgi:hypothetical protein